ncbi:MAG: 3-oxoacyl-[acyl-carrier-protein] reductase [Eubacteriales bacterium]|nr:3-oxoacyl-[acyl-carrier-protein] reductase [Eubacteriales bacterium]
MKECLGEIRRTAIVTGGSRGIGKAVALKLAEDGMNLAISFRGNREAAEETAKQCEAKGAAVLLVQGDVARSEDCEALVSKALEAFGRVDILVNNAGITRDGLLARMSEEDYRAVLEVNLVGPWNMMKATSRVMMKQRYGRIVNMSSVTGLSGNLGQTNYAAAKAGIIGMTKSYAKEVASRGITVNAVAPGFIDTDMTEAMPDSAKDKICQNIPAGRTGKPEDVAAAVHFLVGENAGYITGEVLRVDGGMAM